jgi:hypothetical protein
MKSVVVVAIKSQREKIRMIRLTILLALLCPTIAFAADSVPTPVTNPRDAVNAAPTTSPELALTQEDLTNWSQVPSALDQCVAGITLRNDPTICKGLAAYLQTFSGRVTIAGKQATSTTSQPPGQPQTQASPSAK